MVKRKLLIVGTLVILFGVLCACTNIESIFEDSNISGNDNSIASEETNIYAEENMESEVYSDAGQEEGANNITSEPEVIESTGLSEKELVAIVEAACGKTLEEYNYVYIDMDKDGSYELMATCGEDYIHQMWFCSADGTVCKMINENTWGFYECVLKVTDTDEYALVTSQFYPDMGSYQEYVVWGMKDADIVTVTQGEGTINISADGSINVTRETYSAYWDSQMQTYTGHSWITYFKQYDAESSKFVDVDVVKITEEEFNRFDNGKEVLDDITLRVQAYEPQRIEYIFYETTNNKIYVQCNLFDEK